MSVGKDIRNFFVYGTPHSVAFYVVHKHLFDGFIDPNQYGFSKHAIDKGQYYTLLTANLLHNDREHLLANTLSFIPCCHRMIAYLNKENKWKSSCLFWSIYLLSGVMANIGDYMLASSWKNILLFQFRNDAKMIENINKRFDGMNWKETRGTGASGSIYAMIGFNLCISMELIIKRLYYLYELLDDDGLVEIETFEHRFDVKDYDLEETTRGEVSFDDPQELQAKITRYYSMKLCIDMLWFMSDGLQVYNGCLKRIYNDWQYRKQKRAGRDYLIAFSGIIGDYTHLCGILSGTILYGVYKIFLS